MGTGGLEQMLDSSDAGEQHTGVRHDDANTKLT